MAHCLKARSTKKYFQSTNPSQPPLPCHPTNFDTYGIFQNQLVMQDAPWAQERILDLIPELSRQGEHVWVSGMGKLPAACPPPSFPHTHSPELTGEQVC